MNQISFEQHSNPDSHGNTSKVHYKIACVLVSALCCLLTLKAPAIARSAHYNKKVSQAIAAYRQILNIAPTDFNSRLSLIHCLATAGDYDNAAKEFRLIAEDDKFNYLTDTLLETLKLSEPYESTQSKKIVNIGYLVDGATHFHLATELLARRNKEAALYEYCLAASAPNAEVQALREIGSLLAESGNYLWGRNALARYCHLAPFSFDCLTITSKIARLDRRHQYEMLRGREENEIAQTGNKVLN